MKKKCRKLLTIFLWNILYKTLFETKFVGTWGTNVEKYPWRNYLPNKILIKNSRKKYFLAVFLTNLQKNSHVIREFLVVHANIL